MSGLSKTKKGGAFTYVNFKDGMLIANVDGKKEEFTQLEDIEVKLLDVTDEEFDGKDYKKITLYCVDQDGREYRLGFPLESGYGNSFCCLAPNIDFALPLTISGGIEEIKDSTKKYGKVFISQGGKNLKWYFTKDNENGKKLPKGEKSRDRNGEFTNYEKRNAYFLKMLIDPKKSIYSTIKKNWPDYNPKANKEKPSDPAASVTAPIDDLPF